jgi:hypothetical protein
MSRAPRPHGTPRPALCRPRTLFDTTSWVQTPCLALEPFLCSVGAILSFDAMLKREASGCSEEPTPRGPPHPAPRRSQYRGLDYSGPTGVPRS